MKVTNLSVHLLLMVVILYEIDVAVMEFYVLFMRACVLSKQEDIFKATRGGFRNFSPRGRN